MIKFKNNKHTEYQKNEFPNEFKCVISTHNYHSVLIETTPDVRCFDLFDYSDVLLYDFLSDKELKSLPVESGIYNIVVNIKWWMYLIMMNLMNLNLILYFQISLNCYHYKMDKLTITTKYNTRKLY